MLTEISNKDLEIAKLNEDKAYLNAMVNDKQKAIAELRQEIKETSSLSQLAKVPLAVLDYYK